MLHSMICMNGMMPDTEDDKGILLVCSRKLFTPFHMYEKRVSIQRCFKERYDQSQSDKIQSVRSMSDAISCMSRLSKGFAGSPESTW